jgi:hypothetical protein
MLATSTVLSIATDILAGLAGLVLVIALLAIGPGWQGRLTRRALRSTARLVRSARSGAIAPDRAVAGRTPQG